MVKFTFDFKKIHLFYIFIIISIIGLGYVIAGSIPNPGHDVSQVYNAQPKIDGSCQGQVITAISPTTGAVTCEPDDVGSGGGGGGITQETDPTVIASVKDGVSWGELSNIPSGFADGEDNIGTGSAGLVFQTIDVPTGNDAVADSSNDILKLFATNGISISGDANVDSVTFSIAPNGVTNSRLADYSVTSSKLNALAVTHQKIDLGAVQNDNLALNVYPSVDCFDTTAGSMDTGFETCTIGSGYDFCALNIVRFDRGSCQVLKDSNGNWKVLAAKATSSAFDTQCNAICF